MPKLTNLELAVRQLKGAYRLVEEAATLSRDDYEKGKMGLIARDISRARYDVEELAADRLKAAGR